MSEPLNSLGYWRSCFELRAVISKTGRNSGADGQRLVAPKNWIGSESVTLLQVVCDLLDLVQEMNTQLAVHTHLPGPTDAALFVLNSSYAQDLRAALKEITLRGV